MLVANIRRRLGFHSAVSKFRYWVLFEFMHNHWAPIRAAICSRSFARSAPGAPVGSVPQAMQAHEKARLVNLVIDCKTHAHQAGALLIVTSGADEYSQPIPELPCVASCA